MTQEDKELLLRDLCARLPFGVILRDDYGELVNVNVYNAHIEHLIDRVSVGLEKMMLRPFSGMTEEERKESREWLMLSSDREGNRYFDGFGNVSAADILKGIDWLNAHHFDYRGLIGMDLALEAPEGMYI